MTMQLDRHAAHAARWERKLTRRRHEAIARARRDGTCPVWSEANGVICGRELERFGEMCTAHALETEAYERNFATNGGRA